jgi:hypothetical protein
MVKKKANYDTLYLITIYRISYLLKPRPKKLCLTWLIKICLFVMTCWDHMFTCTRQTSSNNLAWDSNICERTIHQRFDI